MGFPKRVKYRGRVLATIYGKSKSYPLYRVAWTAYAPAYTANERDHGTTMALIIPYGDLNAPRSPLPNPLYVRPILRPDPQPWNGARDERVPFGVNPIDLTHRAVRRLFEGDGAIPPVAPAIRVINFSIGDQLQQFHSAVSARGRLIDWLALKYNVLFCISAGNHKDRIVLDVPRNALAAMTSQAREGAIRYGLVISVEVAEELRLPVYDEIAARIRPAVPVPARTR